MDETQKWLLAGFAGLIVAVSVVAVAGPSLGSTTDSSIDGRYSLDLEVGGNLTQYGWMNVTVRASEPGGVAWTGQKNEITLMFEDPQGSLEWHGVTPHEEIRFDGDRTGVYRFDTNIPPLSEGTWTIRAWNKLEMQAGSPVVSATPEIVNVTENPLANEIDGGAYG